MDRRDFFKTVMSASLLTPLLLASKETDNELELYLIADNPQDYMSLLLRELNRYRTFPEKTYAFLTPHPYGKALKKNLAEKGWSLEHNFNKTTMALSFSSLQKEARPSFTLVKNGSVIDIRSRRLAAIWKEMNHPKAFSTCLTTASFRSSRKQRLAGRQAIIYKEGLKTAVLPLDKNGLKTFRGRKGAVTVKIASGKAWVEESSCRNKICLHTQPVSLVGERIICAPNHFMLTITGNTGVDTVIG